MFLISLSSNRQLTIPTCPHQLIKHSPHLILGRHCHVIIRDKTNVIMWSVHLWNQTNHAKFMKRFRYRGQNANGFPRWCIQRHLMDQIEFSPLCVTVYFNFLMSKFDYFLNTLIIWNHTMWIDLEDHECCNKIFIIISYCYGNKIK